MAGIEQEFLERRLPSLFTWIDGGILALGCRGCVWSYTIGKETTRGWPESSNMKDICSFMIHKPMVQDGLAMKGVLLCSPRSKCDLRATWETFILSRAQHGRSTDHPVTPRRNYCRLWTVENWNAKTDGGRRGRTHRLGYRRCTGQIAHTQPFCGYWRSHTGWVRGRHTSRETNICLVSERVIEPGAVPPQENIPEIDKSQDDDALRTNSSPHSCLKVMSSTYSRARRSCSPLHNDRVDATMEWFSIKVDVNELYLLFIL